MVSYNVHRVAISLVLFIMVLAFGSGKPFHRKSTVVPPTENRKSGKIVDGGDAPRRTEISHPHPYLVSIQYKVNNKYYHTCGGAIIDRWTVLTAAHCFDDDYQPNCWGKDVPCYRVVAGLYDLSADPDPNWEQISEFPSDAIQVHENFDGFHYDNDIAIITLNEPLNFTTPIVKPIKLVNPERPYLRTNATISGWGKSSNDDGAPYVTQILQEARINIYSDKTCSEQWGDDYHSEYMICAAGESFNDISDKVADACQGDSGGPLVAKDVTRRRRFLVGLISWGYECGIREYPGLYTRVETYLPWIKEKRHSMKLIRHQKVPGCATPLPE